MDTWHKVIEAAVLGIIQGLTEFIPVSSTAHVRIAPALLGWEEPGAAFTAVIQLGTLVAALVYFRRDIVQIVSAWVRETVRGQFARSVEARLGWLIILGTLPIAVAGVLLKHPIENSLRSLNVIAGMLIAVAVLMAAAEWFLRRRELAGQPLTDLRHVSLADTAVVGLAQAVALVPGTSRSGVTISAGLFRGLTRESAARFSFLLSLPAVFAAAVLELISERRTLLESHDAALGLVLCTVISGVVGYASIAWLLAYLKRRTMYPFVVYRVALGLLLIWLVSSGRLPADAGAKPLKNTAAAATH